LPTLYFVKIENNILSFAGVLGSGRYGEDRGGNPSKSDALLQFTVARDEWSEK